MPRKQRTPAGQAGARSDQQGSASHKSPKPGNGAKQDRQLIERARAAMADAFERRS